VNEPGQVGRRRFFLLLAPLLFASIAIPTTRSDAADDRGPSAAQVAEGLRTVQDIAADVAAAGSDGEKAQKIDGGIEAVWSKIEDVVRGNDKDAYISFEDNFETLAAAAKAGDAKKAGGAADAIAAAVKAYVAEHPADAPAAAAPADPAPAARSAAAAGDANLARTGPRAASALAALAGAAFALGGLALIAGARRRLSSIA